jgi:hypothetical protein
MQLRDSRRSRLALAGLLAVIAVLGVGVGYAVAGEYEDAVSAGAACVLAREEALDEAETTSNAHSAAHAKQTAAWNQYYADLQGLEQWEVEYCLGLLNQGDSFVDLADGKWSDAGQDFDDGEYEEGSGHMYFQLEEWVNASGCYIIGRWEYEDSEELSIQAYQDYTVAWNKFDQVQIFLDSR